MSILPRDHQLLLYCEEVKKASHDPHRQVGVVIADEDGRILAQGANAPPGVFHLSKTDSVSAIERDSMWKYFMLEHAERNAIFSARDQGISLADATLYGSLFPCADCARAIAAAGIKKVIISTSDNDPARDVKWRDHFTYAQKIFESAQIEVELVSRDSDSRSEAI